MSWNLGAGEKTTFTWASSAVAQVVSIEPPELDRAFVDATVLGDTIKTARPSTLTEVKEATLNVQYNPTAHSTLVTAQTSATEAAAVITFIDPDGTTLETWTWTRALIKSVKVTGATIEKNIEAAIVVHFNDYPTIAGSSPSPGYFDSVGR